MVVHTIEDLLLEWRDHPIAFCNDVFDKKPREVQPEILEALACNEWCSVCACRRLGKTTVASYAAWWFMATRPNALVVTLAPVWSQVVQGIWAQMRELWARSILPGLFPKWEVLTHEVKTPFPMWRAIGMAATNVQNLEARHGDSVLVIIDESKAVPDDFFNSIQGMVGETGMESRILAIGTPGPPIGWFYRSHSTEASLWGYRRQVRATDHDVVARLGDRAERERKRLGENNPWYRQQQLAEFMGADEGTVIPFSKISDAVDRKRSFLETGGCGSSSKWRKTLGLDVAPENGSGLNVLTYRWGPMVLYQRFWQGWDEMRTAAHVTREARAFLHPDDKIIVDSSGVGAGVRSRIKQLSAGRFQVYGFDNSHTIREPNRFATPKAEHLFDLRERFVRDQISIPGDPRLIENLAAYQMEDTIRGKVKTVDPDVSPDFGDSCLYSFVADGMGKSLGGFSADWA